MATGNGSNGRKRDFLQFHRGKGESWVSQYQGMLVLAHQRWGEFGGQPIVGGHYYWCSLDVRVKGNGRTLCIAFPLKVEQLSPDERRMSAVCLDERGKQLAEREQELARREQALDAKRQELVRLSAEVEQLRQQKTEIVAALRNAHQTEENALAYAQQVVAGEEELLYLVYAACEMAEGEEIPRARTEGIRFNLSDELHRLEALVANLQDRQNSRRRQQKRTAVAAAS